MSFPWAAKVNTQTFRKRDQARLSVWRLRRKSLGWFVYLALSGVGMTAVLDTPVARAADTRLPEVAAQFVTQGGAKIEPLQPQTPAAMTITQDSQKVVLNWQTFNIGRDASVTFKQPNATAVALNRVIGNNSKPSEILGSLKANGQIYLLNQNGIIFGQGAVVDTHTLVASTLDISELAFNNGLADAINQVNPLAAFCVSNATPLLCG